MNLPTYLVVAAHNKPQSLQRLIDSAENVDHFIVIDNASTPPIEIHDNLSGVTLIHDWEQPPNLSRLWNIGLDLAAELTPLAHWNVIVVNDDVSLPVNWVKSMSQALRTSNAAVAFPDQFGRHPAPILNTRAETVSAYDRMCGFAHMSKGELGIRFDESMRWWYSDDDYDWQCRLAGGSLMVPNMAVEHTSPDEATNANPELTRQAGLDREVFLQKWGSPPC